MRSYNIPTAVPHYHADLRLGKLEMNCNIDEGFPGGVPPQFEQAQVGPLLHKHLLKEFIPGCNPFPPFLGGDWLAVNVKKKMGVLNSQFFSVPPYLPEGPNRTDIRFNWGVRFLGDLTKSRVITEGHIAVFGFNNKLVDGTEVSSFVKQKKDRFSP